MLNRFALSITGSVCLTLLFSPALWAKEQRIYQTDQYGNIQYHKPSLSVQDNGRIIETDPYGNKQFHKDGYQIKGDKIYQTDKYGNIQYHKPSLTVK